MDGLGIICLGLALVTRPLELPKDVFPINTKQFTMPLSADPENITEMERLRLFVSEDEGKTWTHVKDYKPSTVRVFYSAPHDGLFWFAFQYVFKDGGRMPKDFDGFSPSMKVFVMTKFQVIKPYVELQREVEQLRKTVKRQQKRIEELERNQKDLKPRK